MNGYINSYYAVMKNTVAWGLGIHFKWNPRVMSSIQIRHGWEKDCIPAFLLCVWLLPHMEVTDLRIFIYNPFFLTNIT